MGNYRCGSHCDTVGLTILTSISISVSSLFLTNRLPETLLESLRHCKFLPNKRSHHTSSAVAGLCGMDYALVVVLVYLICPFSLRAEVLPLREMPAPYSNEYVEASSTFDYDDASNLAA